MEFERGWCSGCDERGEDRGGGAVVGGGEDGHPEEGAVGEVRLEGGGGQRWREPRPGASFIGGKRRCRNERATPELIRSSR